MSCKFDLRSIHQSICFFIHVLKTNEKLNDEIAIEACVVMNVNDIMYILCYVLSFGDKKRFVMLMMYNMNLDISD
jgi:hypothetical protein